MKKELHPQYHPVSVKLVNGKKVTMMSTYGKEGDEISLDVDPSVHPAWTGGGTHLSDTGGRVSKFKKLMANLAFKSRPAVVGFLYYPKLFF